MDSAYLSDLFSVEGKVIVLTGGGGVLCGAMARGLARLGARVALVDIRPEAAEQVARDVSDAGGEALPLYGDVTDKATLDPCAEKILERYGSIDALISGAGGNRPEATTTPDMTFFDLPEASLRSVLDLNFTGTVLSAQVFGKHMAKRGEGAIINIASINAIRPLTKILAYSAGKAAVKNFTEWLAVHISQHYSPEIRVNALAPGFFLTNQNRYLLLDQETEAPTPRGQTIIDHTPMRRYGDPGDLLSTVVWLLSPGARFVHGMTVVVDGGFSAFSGV